jgi:hypothetical protein
MSFSVLVYIINIIQVRVGKASLPYVRRRSGSTSTCMDPSAFIAVLAFDEGSSVHRELAAMQVLNEKKRRS